MQHEHDRFGVRVGVDAADPEPFRHARVGGVVLDAADEIAAANFFRRRWWRAVRFSAGAGDQRAARDRWRKPFFYLLIARHRVDHHQRIVVHLETVRRGRIAIGEIFVD